MLHLMPVIYIYNGYINRFPLSPQEPHKHRMYKVGFLTQKSSFCFKRQLYKPENLMYAVAT